MLTGKGFSDFSTDEGIAKDQKFQFPRAPSEKSLEVASDEDQLSKDSPWKPIETEVCGEALSVEEKYHIAAAYSDKNSYHIATGTGVHCICSPLRQQASHGCFFSLAVAGCFFSIVLLPVYDADTTTAPAKR